MALQVTPNVTNPDPGANSGFSTPSNYTVRIVSSSGLVITANLPEQIQLAVNGEWDQPFNKPLSEYFTNSGMLGQGTGRIAEKFNTVAQAGGLTSQNKYMSVAVWTSSSGLSIDLPLVFRAFNDPVKDVTDHIIELMQMCLPSAGNSGMLTPPGPTPLGTATESSWSGGFGGEIITLYMGSFIEIKPIIVQSVSTDILTQYDANGNPMSATVNVSMRTPYVVTKEDMVTFFKMNSYRSGTQSFG